MKDRFTLTWIVLFFAAHVVSAQVPSVQLKIKEKSGFLGMGGPRIVALQLSTQDRQKSLNSDNVNAGQFICFICAPAGDWKIDEDFVKDDLAGLILSQGDQKVPISFKSDITSDGQATSIVLGFQKSFRLEQPFQFQIRAGEVVNQVDYKVPMEYWPGYGKITQMIAGADNAVGAKQYRDAISVYGAILGNSAFQIFPQQAESRGLRLKAFDSYLSDNLSLFQSLRADTALDLKDKIANVEGYRPVFMYVLDSLPQMQLNITPADSGVAPLLERARAAILQIGVVRDSLQKVLDDRNVRWILDGSATERNGIRYQYILETLAYAFSSLNFEDTTAAELKVRIPSDIQARLSKNNLVESYETFLRLCNDRYQAHLAIFPPEFLPNLRKDTAAFPLPFYSMLKAVYDYYSGNLTGCKDEIFRIFRTCYENELTSRFDNLRVTIDCRLNRVPPEVLRLIDDGEELEAKKDVQGAGDKYRQATIIAPNFAFAAFALGKFYVRSGDPVRATTFFEKAYRDDTLYLSAYRESCNLYRKQGNYKPMIEVLTLALDHGNDYWETNSALGQAFMGDGDPARAIERYKRALELNPRSYQTNIQLGQAYQTVKDFQKARECFNKAIEIDALRQEAVDALNKLNEQQRNAR
ncbi:MAG TPA: tetratricopeptide repeat protein [Bacteroidota bacterium]